MNNKMEGYGVFVWPDGRRYEGDYVDDQMNGRGTLRWKSGMAVLEGELRNDLAHGDGVLRRRIMRKMLPVPNRDPAAH